MLYIQYHEFKIKYNNAQKDYDDILSEKERLFARTQPQATVYDKEKVNGGSPTNAFDEYIIEKEKKNIDARLVEARSILEDRERLLKLKEEELRRSGDWYDKAYVYKYIDGLKVREIKYKMPYCRSQIYEILSKIQKNLNIGQNRTKDIVE